MRPATPVRHLRFALAMAVGIIAAMLAAPAAASAGTVFGTVSQSTGYRVVLTSADGTAMQRRIGSSGRFAFRAPNAKFRNATLHLLRPNGRYHGPIVLRRARGASWMLLSGRTTNLGPIVRGIGHARALRAPRLAVNLRITARGNRAGIPVGANRLGLVRRRYVRSGQKLARAGEPVRAGQVDSDLDGVADVFDVDDDGDLRLDSADTTPGGAGSSGPSLHMFTNMKVNIESSLNVNSGEVTRTQVDQLVRDALFMTFTLGGSAEETSEITGIDVNCFRLVYCRPGDGVGVMADPPPGVAEGTRWATYDTDSDGLPNIWKVNGRWDARLRGNVGIGQVGIGDSYVATIERGTSSETVPVSLNFLFLTTPALKRVTSGGVTTDIAYPVSQGTISNPIALAGTSIDVELWRPQRGIVAGAERGFARDMGGLRWGVYLTDDTQSGNGGGNGNGGGPPRSEPFFCQPGDFSDPSSTLRPISFGTAPPDSDPYRDIAADAVPNADRTISFTLDLAACLTRQGLAPAGRTVTVDFEARNENSDNAAQRVTFRLP